MVDGESKRSDFKCRDRFLGTQYVAMVQRAFQQELEDSIEMGEGEGEGDDLHEY